jgi:hypothetical protein
MIRQNFHFKERRLTRSVLTYRINSGRNTPEGARGVWNSDAFEAVTLVEGIALGLAAVKFWTRKKFKACLSGSLPLTLPGGSNHRCREFCT